MNIGEILISIVVILVGLGGALLVVVVVQDTLKEMARLYDIEDRYQDLSMRLLDGTRCPNCDEIHRFDLEARKLNCKCEVAE